ncbi:hypothetical protein ARMSODRAFT_959181 [Armillaria solidipes]|uniref:CFEM domain-containing protein n=1 Tax=Armillaria solidipes TaxID=1076256 RepID=A0A2H3B9K8_9AGAR|nr:hypothetical protein ARMSODRAFT_959181 [Armillaria solidipes]
MPRSSQSHADANVTQSSFRTDLTCICTNTAFQDAAASCLQSTCTAEEQQAAAALQQSECAAGTCISIDK